MFHNWDKCSGNREDFCETLSSECTITECIVDRTIPVEYEHQKNYDLFLWVNWLKDDIDVAFHPANTQFDFQDGNETINDEILANDLAIYGPYHLQFRDISSKMFRNSPLVSGE